MIKEGNQAKRMIRAILSLALLGLCFSAFGAVSPFERAKTAPAKPQETAPGNKRLDGLEFTGLFAVGENVIFSLYDPESKQSVWVPLDGSEDGFSASDFDEADGTIKVTLEGRSRVIAIKENEIVTIKRAAPPVRATPVAATGTTRAVPRASKIVSNKDPVTRQKEEEARMFVSDMLANGMEARERYRKEREQRLKDARAKR